MCFPQKSWFNESFKHQIKQVGKAINHRPVRKFGYLATNQVFLQKKLVLQLSAEQIYSYYSMKKIIIVFILAFLSVISSQAKTMKLKKKDLQQLQRIMAGDFDNELQSKADTSFFNIKLHMKPIWTEEINGYWLYVEQAMATAVDKPYRQRVYHLYKQDDTTLVSKVYEIKNPSQYIGGWKDSGKTVNLSMDSLIDRQGCAIFLKKRKNNIYSGTTPWRECLSTFKGAAYTTSEVVIYKRKIISWDRGWDEKDKQVWGAVKGGYSFIKKKK